jgi:hypothetical protein
MIKVIAIIIIIMQNTMNTYEAVEVHLHDFLTSALRWGQGLAWSGRKNLRYPLDRSWTLEPGLTLWRREKYFTPATNQILVVRPLAV